MNRILMFCLLFVSSWQLTTAQLDQEKADSLELVLQGEMADTLRLKILVELGKTYRDHESSKSINVLRQAFLSARHLNDQTALAEAFATAGTAFGRLGEVDSARFYWTKSYVLLGADTLSRKGAGLLNNLGMTAEMESNLPEAIRYYDRAVQIFMSTDDTFGKAGISNNLGLVYQKQGNYTRAVQAFYQALKGFEEINHVAGQASVANNLGIIAQNQKDFSQALAHYRRSLELKREMADRFQIAISLNNIGTLYKEHGQLDSARYYHNRSLRLKEEIGDLRGQAISLNNLGELAILGGDFHRGLELNERALALETADPHTRAMARIFMGKAHMGLGQQKEAERWLLDATRLSEEIGELQVQYDAKYLLYKLLKDKRPASALQFFEQASTIKDSLFNEENTKALTRLEMEYAFEKEQAAKDQEIALLNSENRLAELQLKTARRRNLAFGAAIVLFALVSLVLYRLFRRIKFQNKIIASTLDERETLLKEIHHRVKNNLQVISSLLNLQSRNLSDESAVAALQEGQNRVRSMALIHQNLYQDDHLFGVSTKEYVEKLCAGLFKSYNIETEKVRMEMDIDDITLDVDHVIPLGLIINELVSNALKYAFADLESGIVSISLQKKDEGLHLHVSDNGIGLPKSFFLQETKSLGFRLIKAFAAKLGAELNFAGENGTAVSIIIPQINYA